MIVNQKVWNDTVVHLGSGYLTSAISSAVASSLNSNITMWTIPILELVTEYVGGLESQNGNLKKLTRAMKSIKPTMRRFCFDSPPRGRFIIEREKWEEIGCCRGRLIYLEGGVLR